MLPPKIREFIKNIREATDNNEATWSSNPDEAEVIGTYMGINIRIKYRFDEISELGVFHLKIIDKNGKEGSFEASQEYSSDYDSLRILFDLAQASELDL